MRENWKITLLLIFSVLLINLSLIFDVGFISDDWSLLIRAREGSVFSPIEQHHYSPFITAVFKFVGYFELSPLWVHLLAFFIHGINIYLVLGLCGRLGLNHWEKWITATLFALSPAGFESLAWCCAIGYILCSTWILLALRLIATARTIKTTALPYQLALLQLLAFATWDWGILLTPLVLVMKWVYLREHNFKGMWPSIGLWCGVLVLKKLTGFSLGYELNPPATAISHLGTSFMLTIWPEFSRSFYTSYWGMGLAGLTLLAFIWMAFRDRISMLGLLLFTTSMIPVLLIGYPQSRYVYLSAVFVYLVFARLFDRNIASRSIAIAYVIIAVFWTIERRDLWIETDLQAKFFKKNVESALGAYEKIALLNVPDQVKGFDLVWLPPVWRCGVECFGPDVLVMNPFGRNSIAEEEIPENVQILQIGDRRKSHSVSR